MSRDRRTTSLRSPQQLPPRRRRRSGRWALQLLERVLARLRQEYARAEKTDLFEELKVFLSGSARPVSHAELAAKYEIASEMRLSQAAVETLLFRARRSLAEALTAEPSARPKRGRPRLAVVQP